MDAETAYSVEELLGMVLAHARQQAEDFTLQKVKVGRVPWLCQLWEAGSVQNCFSIGHIFPASIRQFLKN